jgi:HEAT repeat protein
LIQVLNNDENYWVRAAATKTLGVIGSRKAVKPLIEALSSHNNQLCSSAAEALGNIRSDEAVKPLIEALSSHNNQLCLSAAEALGNIRSDEAVKPLIEALSSHNNQLCSISAQALENIGSKEAVEPLINVLQTQNEDIRCSVSEALGNIGSEKAVESLIQYLDGELNCVRRKVVEALGKIGNKKAIDPIIKVLNSEIQSPDDADYVFCEKAAEALKKIGSEKAEEILMQHLNNEDFNVRKRATKVLGNIGSYKAVELLVQDLKDDDVDGVQWVTVEALRKIAISTIDKNVAFLSQKLPQLVDLIPKVFVEESNISAVITAIQSRCKYYNYTITVPRESSNIMENKMIDFAIITALKIERLAVLKAFGIDEESDRVRKDARTYWRKRLPLKDGKFYEIVVAQCLDMANVNSALLTNDTLHHWQPQAVIMVGIAATAKSEEKQHLGDLVIGKEVYYYEMGKKLLMVKSPNPSKFP